MGSYTGFKKLGDKALDYMMSHRPAVPEDLSEGFHDLDNLFPGIYSGKHRYPTNVPKVDDEAMRAIWKAQGNPEAMIDIYRAVPKGVRDFNTGDWVTTSKTYAKEHGRHSLDDDFEIIKGKARAADISEPGDSIAEQGYWGLPMTGKLSRGILALLASGAGTAALAPGEAEAAPAEPEYTDAGELVAYEATPQEIAEGNRRHEQELLQEPGLESPWLDPVDIMAAPIGVAGTGAKAAAMALDPAVSYGMDKLGGMIGRLWGK